MSGLQIPCPKCGKKLKLPDRSLLGRKGKCPKCSNSFVLEEPDEVRLELAEQNAAAPPIGTGAKWIPDAPAAPPMPAAPGAWPANVPYPQAYLPQGYVPPGYLPPGYVAVPTQYVPMPQMLPPGYAMPPMPAAPGFPNFAQSASTPTEFPGAEPGNLFAAFDDSTPTDSRESPASHPFGSSARPASASGIDDSDFLLRKKKKQRQARQKKMMFGVFGALTLLIAGSALIFRESLFAPANKPKSKSLAVADPANEPGNDEPEWQSPVPVRPTKGEPIELLCMPSGVTVVVHLRPADLWASGSKGEEFRFCLGPLGEWLETQIKEICRFEPTKIEEVTFGLIRGFAGDPMQVSALVRLKDAVQKTDLIKSFQAKLDDASDYPIYVGDQYAYAIKDLRTFAVCPVKLQAGMTEAVNRPNPQAVGIETLLRQTDRQRHAVLVVEPAVLDAEVEFMFAKELRPFALNFLEFFQSKQVETLAWSLHVGNEKFHSEVLLRNKSPLTKSQLQQQMKQKLNKLPHDILAAVEKMNPQVAGPRQIIGRFPAMAKVFSLATHASSGERFASLATSLPERAAPNLAIGALLTWDESTRTNFSKPAVDKPKETGPSKLPDLVADRLKQLKLEIEFTKMPLQDGLKYIADECKINLDIDGDALKAAGFTKNMEQNIKLGKVTGLEAIGAIVKKYEKERVPIVLVIDESKKVALITTKEFAEKGNLTVYPTP